MDTYFILGEQCISKGFTLMKNKIGLENVQTAWTILINQTIIYISV